MPGYLQRLVASAVSAHSHDRYLSPGRRRRVSSHEMVLLPLTRQDCVVMSYRGLHSGLKALALTRRRVSREYFPDPARKTPRELTFRKLLSQIKTRPPSWNAHCSTRLISVPVDPSTLRKNSLGFMTVLMFAPGVGPYSLPG